jgi:hypothetical protein
MTVDLARTRVHELEDICRHRITVNSVGELASCYFTLGDSEKALPLAKQAWDWDRKNSALAMNLAMIYKDLGRHEESFHVIESAYWMNPDDFYIQLGYAEAMLKAGFWKRGWTLYDNARPTQAGAAIDLRIPANVPEWNGQPLKDTEKLLVINEGGMGDRLSYARWLPKLTEMGVPWLFYPYAPSFPFHERVFPRELLVADGDEIDGFTHWATTFSLPSKLNCGPLEIPPPLPFTAPPEKIQQFTIKRVDTKPVIGLCFKAAEMFQGGRTVRSLNASQAMRLRCMTGDIIHWVNLQFGEPQDPPIVNPHLKSWEDTAGLIHNLDAVVTVDTAVMHLAGGMKKPMAVLLASNSCWKYLRTGRKLPLYPTARFYRNDGHGAGFEHAINELVLALRSGTAFQ